MQAIPRKKGCCFALAPGKLKILAMRIVFWTSLVVVGYAYVGYALLLMVLARRRPRHVLTAPVQPSVSIVIAAHNEEANLGRKLENIYAFDYPPASMQIVVASDGSTDGTTAILRQHASRVTSVVLPVAQGKAGALNAAVLAATGDLLVFMDVRQTVDVEALQALASCFADPDVGAVSGELHLETADGHPSPDALGIYWKIEKLVRKLESSTGSVVGVTGALFAMRRGNYVPLPPGTLLDDVLTPMQVARQGKRILFLESACARDRIFTQKGKEFSRKVRTLTGNYQLLQLAPWLLTGKNPLLFRLISHKLLRLLVPFLLLLLLISSALAAGLFYHVAFCLQLLLYGCALTGTLLPTSRRFRLISVAYTFTMLNVAAAFAFYNFVAGRARWA